MLSPKKANFDALFITAKSESTAETTAKADVSTLVDKDESRVAGSGFHISQHAQNATDRFEEKVNTALLWIWQWHYSTPKLIDMLVSQRNNARSTDFIQKLEKHGLVTCRDSGLRGLKNLPTKLVFLTRSGLDQAMLNSDKQFKPCLTTKFDSKYLDHHLTVQKLTLDNMRAGKLVDFIPETQIPAGHDVAKIPDAIWLLKNGHSNEKTVVAVELELTQKYDRAFDMFCSESYKALNLEIYNSLIVISRSKPLLLRYSQTLRPDGQVNNWYKDKNGTWAKGRPLIFDETITNSINFAHLDGNGDLKKYA